MPTNVRIENIVNHTHRLEKADIREIVEDWMDVHGEKDVTILVDPVHAAPAHDGTLMTKAARAWRSGEGEEAEFQEHANGGLCWFGIRYTIQEPEPDAPDDETPTAWPPEGAQEPDPDAADPRIADQLDLDAEPEDA